MRWMLVGLMLLFSAAHGEVLATVGSSKITREDITRKFEDLKSHSMIVPPPDQFLEDMIRLELGAQEAERLKLQNDPQVRDAFKQVLYNALIEKQFGKKLDDISVTEKDLQAYYKKNPEVHIEHILVQIVPNPRPIDMELARKRALEIMADVKQPKANFEELARQSSDDTQSKDLGGDIGFHTRLTLVGKLYDAAASMKPGEIKGPIQTPYGFHILKLIEKRDYDLADKRTLRAAYIDEKRTQMVNDYFAKLKKQYKVHLVEAK